MGQAEAATIYFAGGVDSFGLFWRFFVRCPGGETGPTVGFLPVCRSRSTPRINDRFALVRGSSEANVEFFLEAGLIVFFQLAHFEHDCR